MFDKLPTPSPERPVLISLMRGMGRRCPQCGKGALLAGYLTPVKNCDICGEDFSAISADDGPAWATLLVLGHAVVPLMVFLGRDETIPIWLAISILMVVMLGGVFVLLPCAKGLFIALIWATDATGDVYNVEKTTKNSCDTTPPFSK